MNSGYLLNKILYPCLVIRFFKLQAVRGIALPLGSKKLYSGSIDGTVRVWDGHSGKCVNLTNLGGEVTSLITEGPWVFIGMKSVIKVRQLVIIFDLIYLYYSLLLFSLV